MLFPEQFYYLTSSNWLLQEFTLAIATTFAFTAIRINSIPGTSGAVISGIFFLFSHLFNGRFNFLIMRNYFFIIGPSAAIPGFHVYLAIFSVYKIFSMLLGPCFRFVPIIRYPINCAYVSFHNGSD